MLPINFTYLLQVFSQYWGFWSTRSKPLMLRELTGSILAGHSSFPGQLVCSH